MAHVVMSKVTLPDGKALAVADGATVGDVAAMIGPGLAKAAIAGKIDGQIADLSRPVPEACRLEILKADAQDPDSLYVLRHSTRMNMRAVAIPGWIALWRFWASREDSDAQEHVLTALNP